MSEYYAVVRSTDHLAHYGVKGMKWGVRKALARGNDRALDRNFRRAAKKLKKLTDIGINSKKYAAKSVAYGVAAAGTGTMVIGGKKFAGDVLKSAKKVVGAKNKIVPKTIGMGYAAGLNSFARAQNKLTATKAIGKGAGISGKHAIYGLKAEPGKHSFMQNKRRTEKPNNAFRKIQGSTNENVNKVLGALKSDTAFRIGAGAATAGLAALSGVNAYRASHGAKYRKKALEYKNAMDEVFSGTKYSGKYVAEPRRRKRKTKNMG